MTKVPDHLRVIADRVEGRLRTLMDSERARWSGLDGELAAPFDALDVLLMSGGKRLRPAFCHWGWVGAGGDPDASVVVDAGAAFELLHAFALVHDDVMDGSATRRGERTTHLSFADRHAAGRWAGEARRFGEGVAILVGDLAFVYADQLMRAASPASLAVWDELRIELNIGQYLDIFGTASGDRSQDRAERISRYKSGKYTVERPLHLGASLASPEQFARLEPGLSAYGLPLGDAFQLRDDVLGAFGDESLTGKPVGDDLREGKPTPLLAIATARAEASQHEVLSLVGRCDLTMDEVAAIQAVLVETGALSELETRIEHLAKEAIDSLSGAEMTQDAKDALVELAHYVAWRES